MPRYFLYPLLHTLLPGRSVVFRMLVAALLLLFLPQNGRAQAEPPWEEMAVSVHVEGLGAAEIPALIKEELLWLSVRDLFDFLHIDYALTSGNDTISGFLFRPEDKFLIDETQALIRLKDKTFQIDSSELLLYGAQIYLESKNFGAIFGLPCTFNIRGLSVILKPEQELPIIRTLRMERTRTKTQRLENVFIPDASIGKKYRTFHIGNVDWNINATQTLQRPSYTRLGLTMGGVIAGGEFKGVFIHTLNQPFVERQQYYLWRYADNKKKIVRQVLAGKISTQSISSIFTPVLGVQITNAPTYARRSYGTYAYSAYVQPNWGVELYVNNVLIDYVRSDAMGLINYNVPLMYGNTEVTMRYTGPWGDEHTHTRTFVVPHSFLPARTLEYKASAGIVQDSSGSFFSQGRISYGLTDKITAGAGVEYLGSLDGVRSLPFLTTTLRLASNMILSGEYVQGVRYKGVFNCNLPSRLQVELNYVKYEQQQEAVRYNYREERRVSVSMPLRLRQVGTFSRLTLFQNSNGSRQYMHAEYLFTLARRNLNLNINSFAFYNSGVQADVYTSVSSALRLPGMLVFTPRITYRYDLGQFTVLNLSLTKNFSRHFAVQAAFEQRFDLDLRYARVGFKYDGSFARFSTNVVANRDIVSFMQAASGSINYEKKLNYVDFSRSSSLGKGGILLVAFLDINENGRREKFEPIVANLNAKIYGGGGRREETPQGILVSGLEPYLEYKIQLDGNDFDNLSWRILKTRLSVLVDPNQIKEISIPVVALGEVSGTVFLQNDDALRGLGRINVMIYDRQAKLVATLLTEDDGYFSHLGLKPGKYSARLDKSQLERLQMEVPETAIEFKIKSSRDGDVVDDLAFFLSRK